jgi:hypothetical protein
MSKQKMPFVPPVYRPGVAPAALQRKALTVPKAPAMPAPARAAQQMPVTPPVYRPAPVSKVFQQKPAARVTPTTAAPPHVPVRGGMSGRAPVARPAQILPPRSLLRNPTPRSHANRLTIQRYSTATIDGLGGAGKLSQSGNYFLPDVYGGELIYVKAGAAAPRNSTPHRSAITVSQGTYQGYAPPMKQFFRDCLHTAEEIISGTKLDYKEGGDYSKVAGTGEIFGVDTQQNVARATRQSQGDAASPSMGQAYVIVNTDWPSGAGAPYHAAGVVAVDGNDRITLEVFATSTEAKRRTESGGYKMYSVASGSGDLFHSYWQANYFGANSITTVIERI